MKKMIIVLVVVICAQLILTLCYKEKSTDVILMQFIYFMEVQKFIMIQ